MKMLPCLTLLAVAVAAATFSTSALGYGKEPGTPTLSGNLLANRYIVQFKIPSTSSTTDAAQASAINDIVSAYGASAIWIRRTGTGAGVVRIVANDGASVTLALEALAQQANVAYAVQDRLLTATATTNDPSFSQLWGMQNTPQGISVANAWNRGTGAGAVIAVVDTGITTHPDLDGNRLPGYDFISVTSIANDGDGRDASPNDPGDYFNGAPSSWHGSHVSGTAAAVGNNGVGVVGVAYGAKFLPVRALGTGGGTLSDIADGIIWAAGGSVPGVPANPTPATVINLSLGAAGACGPTERAAIDFALGAGVIVVVAAGNATADAAAFTPASCPGVITVGATDSTGARATYSNYGPSVEIVAPGTGILSTRNNGTQGPTTPNYSQLSGTSMASPHVAGVVALMQSIYPRSPRQVTSILQRTAKPLSVACPQGCGSGLLNADAATTAAATWPAPIFNPVLSSTCSSPTTIYVLNNTSTDPNDAIVSVLWDFGDGRTSTQWSPVVKYPNASPNSRVVTLTVTDAAGNSSSDSITIDTRFYCTL